MMMNILFESRFLGKKIAVYGTIENPLFAVKEVATWIKGASLYSVYKAVKEEDLVSLEYFNGNIQHFENYLTLEGVHKFLDSCCATEEALLFAEEFTDMIEDAYEWLYEPSQCSWKECEVCCEDNAYIYFKEKELERLSEAFKRAEKILKKALSIN